MIIEMNSVQDFIDAIIGDDDDGEKTQKTFR